MLPAYSNANCSRLAIIVFAHSNTIKECRYEQPEEDLGLVPGVLIQNVHGIITPVACSIVEEGADTFIGMFSS